MGAAVPGLCHADGALIEPSLTRCARREGIRAHVPRIQWPARLHRVARYVWRRARLIVERETISLARPSEFGRTFRRQAAGELRGQKRERAGRRNGQRPNSRTNLASLRRSEAHAVQPRTRVVHQPDAARKCAIGVSIGHDAREAKRSHLEPRTRHPLERTQHRIRCQRASGRSESRRRTRASSMCVGSRSPTPVRRRARPRAVDTGSAHAKSDRSFPRTARRRIDVPRTRLRRRDVRVQSPRAVGRLMPHRRVRGTDGRRRPSTQRQHVSAPKPLTEIA